MLTRKVEALKQKIQQDIHFCYNCQAYDSGEMIWVQGRKYDLEDLFEDYNVKEELRDDLANNLVCLNCGTELARYDEIGLEETNNIEIKVHLKKARSKYLKRIQRLSLGIRQYPTLALSMPLGKLIYSEIKKSKLPNTSIEGVFFRSRNIEGPNVLSANDFSSPPLGVSKEGRFNHSGQSHFYLSKYEDTAILEGVSSVKPSLIWLQKIELSRIDNILDLSSNWDKLGPSNSTLLVALHDSSELKKNDSNIDNWRPDYCLTRFIMDCAKQCGYSGIQYLSAKNHYGINVVLFEFNKKNIIMEGTPTIVTYSPPKAEEMPYF